MTAGVFVRPNHDAAQLLTLERMEDQIAHSQPQEALLASQTQTQTQHVWEATQESAEVAGVLAWLNSLTEDGIRYALRSDRSEVRIGRSPKCDISLTDPRVSKEHVSISHDGAGHFFVKAMSPRNCCFVNEQRLRPGETRALQHGNVLSLCINVAGNQHKDKPPAAFIFRQCRGGVHCEDSAGLDVKETWVHEHWSFAHSLGAGTFSEVKLAVRVSDGSRWAVKIVDKKKFETFQTKRKSCQNLCDEAQFLKTLDHPGIVRCDSWVQSEAFLYLFLELVEGGDLLRCIVEHGAFADHHAHRVFLGVVEAMAYLHSKAIIHRDLKPENILLTSRNREDMEPKLADFGLARQGEQQHQTICGTPHYFAPEVLQMFQKPEVGTGYGKAADVWSLGVVLYILLSGVPPFEEEDLYEQILKGKYSLDEEEWATVSAAARDLVLQLLVVDPQKRPLISEVLKHRWLRMGRDGSAETGARSSSEQPFKRTRCEL